MQCKRVPHSCQLKRTGFGRSMQALLNIWYAPEVFVILIVLGAWLATELPRLISKVDKC